MSQGVIPLLEGQGALLEDDAGRCARVFGYEAFRIFRASFFKEGRDDVQTESLDGNVLRIFGKAVSGKLDGSRQVSLFQKKAAHGVHGRRLPCGVFGVHPACEFFQCLRVGTEGVFSQKDVEGVHQQRGVRLSADEGDEPVFSRSGGVDVFLFRLLRARFFLRLPRIAFFPENFPFRQCHPCQITDFCRVGGVVRNGSKCFNGLIYIALDDRYFSVHQFCIGKQDGRLFRAGQTVFYLFEDGLRLRIVLHAGQGVRQQDVGGV